VLNYLQECCIARLLGLVAEFTARETRMAVCWLLTDAAGAAIAPRLAASQHKAGSPPERSARLCLETGRSMARTGLPWRDMPSELGHWEARDNRFRRWDARGIWRQLWEHLHRDACHVALHLFLARTMVRAPQPAAGARQKPAGTRHRLRS
jgi:transposase